MSSAIFGRMTGRVVRRETNVQTTLPDCFSAAAKMASIAGKPQALESVSGRTAGDPGQPLPEVSQRFQARVALGSGESSVERDHTSARLARLSTSRRMTFEAGGRSELLKGAFAIPDNTDAIIVWPGPAKGKAQIESTKLDVLEKQKAARRLPPIRRKQRAAGLRTSRAQPGLGPPGGPRLDQSNRHFRSARGIHPAPWWGESSLRTPLLIALRQVRADRTSRLLRPWLSSGRSAIHGRSQTTAAPAKTPSKRNPVP